MPNLEVFEKFPKLYHYTTMEGLEGILTSQAFHASHIAYLNDHQETKALRAELSNHVRILVKDIYAHIAARNPLFPEAMQKEFGSADGAIDRETQVIIDTLYKVTYEPYSDRALSLNPFVISFCAHENDYEANNGLLSQWRGYGNETGAALVFDTAKLWELMKEDSDEFLYEPIFFAETEYADDEFSLDEAYPDFAEALNLCIPSLFKERNPDIKPLFMPFLRASCTLKHQGFSEEKEVRAVFVPISQSTFDSSKHQDREWFEKNRHKKVKTVMHRSGLVPYISVFDNPKQSLPIERIIIGPGRNSSIWLPRIERYLQNSDILVTCSETPLL